MKLAGNYDFGIMFTDGLVSVEPEFSANFPMYIFSASERANHTLLKSIAHRTGGQFFNIFNKTDVLQIQERMQQSSFKFLSAKFSYFTEDGNKLDKFH
jgi:hypothetical protein